MFPESGGPGRFAHHAFGSLAGATFGWFSYVQAATIAPIEVLAAIEYLSTNSWANGLYNSVTGTLSASGYVVAVVLMGVFVTLNLLGIRLLSRANSAITVFKLAIPSLTALALIAGRLPHPQLHRRRRLLRARRRRAHPVHPQRHHGRRHRLRPHGLRGGAAGRRREHPPPAGPPPGRVRRVPRLHGDLHRGPGRLHRRPPALPAVALRQLDGAGDRPAALEGALLRPGRPGRPGLAGLDHAGRRRGLAERDRAAVPDRGIEAQLRAEQGRLRAQALPGRGRAHRRPALGGDHVRGARPALPPALPELEQARERRDRRRGAHVRRSAPGARLPSAIPARAGPALPAPGGRPASPRHPSSSPPSSPTGRAGRPSRP